MENQMSDQTKFREGTTLQRYHISRTLIQIAVAFIVVLLFADIQASQAQTEPVPLPAPITSNLVGSGSLSNRTNPDGGSENVETSACVTHKSPTQLAWFYKPPANIGVKKLVQNFETYVLTRKDEVTVEKIHNKGDEPVLQYIKFDALSDPCHQAEKPIGTACSCSQAPMDNAVGWNAEDICNIRDEHPEWFLRDQNGNLIYYQDHVIMDVGQAGWRNFWVNRMETAIPDGWDGVFIDNLNTSFNVHGSNPDIVLQDYTNAEHQQAVVGFLQYAQNNLFKPNSTVFYANFSSTWGDNDIYFAMLQHLNGTQDEFWAVPREGYYSVLSWEDRLLRMGEAADRGKKVILVSLGGQSNHERQQFALASYLLIAGNNVFFRYSNQSAYQQAWLYPNYLLPLGNPTGDYVKKAEKNKWKRNFANGKVVVKPESHTGKIKIFDADGTVCN